MADAGEVTVEVYNQVARLVPGEVKRLLATDLTYTPTNFVPGGPLGYRRRNKPVRLFHRDAKGDLWVPAGLVPLAVRKLEEAGCRVCVEYRYSLDERARPSDPVLNAARGTDWDFLAAVAREPRGVVEARGAADVVRLVALLCRLFPHARVMIALNVGLKQMLRLRRRLQRAGAGRVDVLGYYPWPQQGGRLLCSLAHLDASGKAKHHDFDVVVLPEALQALAPEHTYALTRLPHHRVYGSVPVGAALSGRARLKLQALVGPVIYRSPDPRGDPAEVVVHWCQPPWAPPAGDVTALERKRSAFWGNVSRNDYIAAVARAFSERDEKTLWGCGLLLADGGGITLTNRPAVTVLVESTEHARALLRRLPGWEVLDAAPTPPGARSAFTVQRCKLRPLDRVIVTALAAARLATLDADVLVRAGPECPLGQPELPGFPPRSVGPRRVVLVDVADDCDGLARAAVGRRLRDYAARGWASAGAPSSAVHDGLHGYSEERGADSTRRNGIAVSPARTDGRPGQLGRAWRGTTR
jgi:hypothetical protein